jgi:hypothetical protein
MKSKFEAPSFLLIALLLVIGTPGGSAAQDAPLFVAIPETFPNVDARALIVREPGREIVVLNPTSAGVEELGTALSLLTRIRRERGQPTKGQLIPIVGFAGELRLGTARRARLEAALAELRRRPFANVGNLGRGRWMRLDPR